MKILSTSFPDVFIIEPAVVKDQRGFFMEIHQQRRYSEAGIEAIFVQDNLSRSVQGTLRGLHYQVKHAQTKLIQVIEGSIFDVTLDIRRGSPYFGQWTSVHLSDENRRQLFLPEGFAHGYCVLSEFAQVVYKCTDYYSAEDEGGVLWSDPTLAITWPISEPLLSDKDSQQPCLADIPPERLPVYEENR